MAFDGSAELTGEFEAILPSTEEAVTILASHGQEQPEPKGVIDELCATHLAEEMVAIERAALYPDGRPQNNAEHSFKLGIMCVGFANSQRRTDLDIDRLIPLSNGHDLLETYSGDTPVVDKKMLETKRDREIAGIAMLLSRDFGGNSYMYDLIMESFRGETPEAKFVGAMDKFEPIHFALHTKAKTQRERQDDFPTLVRTQLPKMAVDRSVFRLGIVGFNHLGIKWDGWGCKPFEGNAADIIDETTDMLIDQGYDLQPHLIKPLSPVLPVSEL